MAEPRIVLDVMWEESNLSDYLTKNVPVGWEPFFAQEEVMAEIKEISQALQEEKKPIWPILSDVFNAFKLCPFDQLKVVIVGQDPYHTPDTASGLAFSGKPEAKVPSSLRNVFQKLRQENYTANNSYLGSWAEQGVFLINTALTVAESSPGSHIHHWNTFTYLLFKYIAKKEKVVWILWGNKAEIYKNYVPAHSFLITGGHPSPLNRTGSFLKSDYFRVCNQYLQTHKIAEINWNL